jgi:hypothetical protein
MAVSHGLSKYGRKGIEVRQTGFNTWTRPAIWCQKHWFCGQRGTEFLEDATKRLTNASIFCSLGMMGQRDEKGIFKV